MNVFSLKHLLSRSLPEKYFCAERSVFMDSTFVLTSDASRTNSAEGSFIRPLEANYKDRPGYRKTIFSTVMSANNTQDTQAIVLGLLNPGNDISEQELDGTLSLNLTLLLTQICMYIRLVGDRTHTHITCACATSRSHSSPVEGDR